MFYGWHLLVSRIGLSHRLRASTSLFDEDLNKAIQKSRHVPFLRAYIAIIRFVANFFVKHWVVVDWIFEAS
jgi:hypothetical protein